MISVVIPSYNRRDSVLRLLADLQAQRGVDLEIIVVDDHSRDGSAAAFAAAHPRVRVLQNPVNRGPAVTRNRGILAAQGAIVVGLDSDVTVPDPALLQTVEARFSEMPRVDGFAFRLFGPDGVSDDTPRWWHPVPIGSFSSRRFETCYFSGTGYAFRRESVVQAGLFPEILFMHYEEVELAYRMVDAGMTLMYMPDLAVVHHEHRVSRRSEVRDYYKPRNQILLAAACLPLPRALGYLAPRVGYNFLQSIKNLTLRPFYRAMRDALRTLPARLRERRPPRNETFARISAMRRVHPLLS